MLGAYHDFFTGHLRFFSANGARRVPILTPGTISKFVKCPDYLTYNLWLSSEKDNGKDAEQLQLLVGPKIGKNRFLPYIYCIEISMPCKFDRTISKFVKCPDRTNIIFIITLRGGLLLEHDHEKNSMIIRYIFNI